MVVAAVLGDPIKGLFKGFGKKGRGFGGGYPVYTPVHVVHHVKHVPYVYGGHGYGGGYGYGARSFGGGHGYGGYGSSGGYGYGR